MADPRLFVSDFTSVRNNFVTAEKEVHVGSEIYPVGAKVTSKLGCNEISINYA
jgi:hypothetical protein